MCSIERGFGNPLFFFCWRRIWYGLKYWNVTIFITSETAVITAPPQIIFPHIFWSTLWTFHIISFLEISLYWTHNFPRYCPVKISSKGFRRYKSTLIAYATAVIWLILSIIFNFWRKNQNSNSNRFLEKRTKIIFSYGKMIINIVLWGFRLWRGHDISCDMIWLLHGLNPARVRF